jgi:hypothetical protein
MLQWYVTPHFDDNQKRNDVFVRDNFIVLSSFMLTFSLCFTKIIFVPIAPGGLYIQELVMTVN